MIVVTNGASDAGEFVVRTPQLDGLSWEQNEVPVGRLEKGGKATVQLDFLSVVEGVIDLGGPAGITLHEKNTEKVFTAPSPTLLLIRE